jgi:hypothetical protein
MVTTLAHVIRHERNVRHYAEGKRDWREAGLPLESGV